MDAPVVWLRRSHSKNSGTLRPYTNFVQWKRERIFFQLYWAEICQACLSNDQLKENSCQFQPAVVLLTHTTLDLTLRNDTAFFLFVLFFLPILTGACQHTPNTIPKVMQHPQTLKNTSVTFEMIEYSEYVRTKKLTIYSSIRMGRMGKERGQHKCCVIKYWQVQFIEIVL